MTTATYKINNEHNGIEIYFDSMPDKETLNRLHEKKWRWHKVKKCWYHVQDEDAVNFVKNICNVDNINNVSVNVETFKSDVITNVHGVNIGDIFYTSYGYDMTLVTFYQVIKVTAKRATVKAIASEVVEGNNFSGECVPVKDMFISEKTISTGTDISYDGKSNILKNINGHFGYRFDERPVYFNHLD